ncbi:agmatinase [Peptostreptococcus equinus]|uniref:Agmatinase n=1 Tax=Peptostreptococcus equinus TaxID=3003601 RepID=A0ABY7JNM5_9FIRM|nr:agmatinase [Peptostreptococcus sp. CBA3647]WAW14980.1 agmatinase [Peptostreptococcus sp. CBA3647]
MIKANPAFMACDTDYEDAKIVIFGAPFDGTVSYRPGTRFASAEVRKESYGIESYSPFLQKDLEEKNICDIGDLDLPFGNARRALDEIYKNTKMIITDSKTPLMIGGEHLVTLGCVEAVYEKYPDLCILHLDAHADLREDYLGEKLSHASVIRRCYELIGDGKIFQLGIRSMTKDEDLFAQKHTYQCKYNLSKLDEYLEIIGNRPLYITIDLDVLDPAFFPGTGTPEPCGISSIDLINAIHKFSGLNIVAIDVNELSPHYDHSGVSTITACKMIRELLLTI